SDGLAVANRRPKHKHTKNGAASVTGANSTIGLGGANSSLGFADPGHQHVTLINTNSTPNTGATILTVGPTNNGNPTTAVGTGCYFTGGNSTLGITGANSSIGVSDTITIGPQTGAEPVDCPPYFVLIPQVKL